MFYSIFKLPYPFLSTGTRNLPMIRAALKRRSYLRRTVTGIIQIAINNASTCREYFFLIPPSHLLLLEKITKNPT